MIAAVHDGDALGEVREKDRLLDRGVATADHDHILALVEEAVAGGAGRHAVALEMILRGDAEPARLRARADHEHVAGVDRTAVTFEPERAPLQINLGDLVEHDLGADVLGLGLHLLHEPGALDHVGKARVVLDIGGYG